MYGACLEAWRLHVGVSVLDVLGGTASGPASCSPTLFFQPSSTADASLLSGMQSGNYRAALRRFGDLRKQGLQPSAMTYTALLTASAKAGQLKVACAAFLRLQPGIPVV